MSADSARSGETYSTCTASGSGPASPARTRSSMTVRNAASVLPLPVGAASSVCCPARMAGQAPSCAGVGAENALAEPGGNRGVEGSERHARGGHSGCEHDAAARFSSDWCPEPDSNRHGREAEGF